MSKRVITIIVVVIALVVVGALVMSDTSPNDMDDFTSQEQTVTYVCEGGEEIEALFLAQAQVTVTLPDEGPIELEPVESDSGDRYENQNGSLVFVDQDGEVTVLRDGQAVYQNCVEEGSEPADTSTQDETEEEDEENPADNTQGQTQDEAEVAEDTQAQNQDIQDSDAASDDQDAVVVTYTNSGFSPETVTIQQGQTVQFENESSGGMWVASDVHPTHQDYSGTSLQEHCQDGASDSFDQCEAGDSYSFIFDQSGTWQYHNHLNSADGGSVVVQ